MLHLSIVTPERKFIDVTCVSVTLPGESGEMQILPGHAELMANLKAGIVNFQKENHETIRFMVGEGVVEVSLDNVNLLCEQASYKDEIDKVIEEKLAGELEQHLNKLSHDEAEQKRVSFEIARVMAKLSLFE